MNRKYVAIYPLVVCLLLAGCTDNSSQLSAQENEKQPTAAETNTHPLIPGETWDVFVVQGSRVGYGCTTIKRVMGRDGEKLLTENVSHISVRRGTDTSEQTISSASLETPQGELISFQSKMQMGPGAIRSTGKVNGDKLDIEMTSPGGAKPISISLPWSSECLGPYASEQSLVRRPMKPGERRTFKTIIIGFNQIGEMTLTAKNLESVKLLKGTKKLLRINTTHQLPDGQKINGVVWCDDSGETLKTFSEAMGLETYRVNKSEALRESDSPGLDLMPSMLVKVDRPIMNPHQTKRVRYRVRLKGSDPADSFAVGPTQSVKSIDPHTAEITVYAIRPGEKGGNPNTPADKPTDADLASNTFIQSDDELIRTNAEKAAGGETDPWRVAVALERFVKREMKNTNYTQAFATAAEVARSHEGDCSEYAVYLAALCRARGIPARMAIGLVYLKSAQVFGFHAWTEVYVDGRWTPIDATRAQGGIGAAHLKIASSDLKDASVYNVLLPVFKLIGGLRIEIVDTSPQP